jgi:hypothetical protein
MSAKLVAVLLAMSACDLEGEHAHVWLIDGEYFQDSEMNYLPCRLEEGQSTPVGYADTSLCATNVTEVPAVPAPWVFACGSIGGGVKHWCVRSCPAPGERYAPAVAEDCTAVRGME